MKMYILLYKVWRQISSSVYANKWRKEKGAIQMNGMK